MLLYSSPQISVSITQSLCLLQRTTRHGKKEESFFHNFNSTLALNRSGETIHLSINDLVSFLRALLDISNRLLVRQELQRRAAAEGISVEHIIKCFYSHSDFNICKYSQCSADLEDNRNSSDQSTLKLKIYQERLV